MFMQRNVINGEWMTAESTIPVHNPATKQVIGQVPNASEAMSLAAVDAAYDAFQSWSRTTAKQRSALLLKWHALIDEHKDMLATIMTEELGRPLEGSRTEVDYANQFVEWYAEEGKRIYGEMVPSSSTEKRIFVKKEPIGVVGAITPWNFPAAMVTRKLAPALAAGCTVVLKPSEETPYTAIKLVQLAHQAGIPNGVINLVTGDPVPIVDVWQKDGRVRKITFTGSTPVGKMLMRGASDTMKKLSLELGGHAPFIVTEHADIDKAVEEAIASKFRNAGQACIAANRFFVQKSIAEDFKEKFSNKVKQLVVGNGYDRNVDIGPLINERAVKKVKAQMDDALQRGATLVTGGNVIMEDKGYFIEPTVLMHTTDDMLCMQEETFGPLAPITSFDTLEEAIRRANKSPFGLSAYAFTKDIKEAMILSEQLEYGIIGINDGQPSTAQAPFGGIKESGLGREGGHQGIQDYLETKYISLSF
ncbi:NAD-dependent succinate-semialdehyde dehydrogenase [Longirhabdus pacifica]|uniref:NAD-dependent succinate-semialdehyde dehydrogenase n=1 Tax=Longirhabdus pacifica TaxID=2305227 RepID=UPI001008F281|nr:NAD-dependent succinate-semialdehyde dehydrogenase [Longirhabdus pacifica]